MPDQFPHGVRGTALWSQVDALLDRRAQEVGQAALDVLDVGGGSGVFAVPLAMRGHRVTVVDPSPNALATLKQRAAEAHVTSRVEAVQGDAASLAMVVEVDSADVMLCHGVLEVVDDPQAAVAGIVACLRPAALASIVAAQRNAAAIAKAVGGHLEEARHLLEDPDGRWGRSDPLPRRFSEVGLTDLLTNSGLVVDAVYGVRIFTDLVPGPLVDDATDVRALAALEATAGRMPELRALAGALHVTAIRE
ncbi:class I SAM-dependent methyltransferase [Phytoactinopolyspora limicola]|uniref:class I SAM-dependent methyltransferase n=1 Tax=Phytoactinopolyspora limicola TaxID=2715536 RepID=UPI00140CBCC6|nr:methyltransferase domain-containing protein [Phytoactinopolyspora limicola]